MAIQHSGNEIADQRTGESRRGFLAKLALGAAALALVGASLGRKGWRRDEQTAASQEFPGEDSIFHPASDPRTDPRRS